MQDDELKNKDKVVKLLLFGADVVYSHFEPNMGEGVIR